MEACQKQAEIYERQGKRLKELSGESAVHRDFTQLFGSSPLGLGVTNLRSAQRDKRKQSHPRAESIKLYDARLAPKKDILWCPILWQYRPGAECAHIVPPRTSDGLFEAIFTINEKMSPSNTMMMDGNVKALFDKYYLTIVPDVDYRSPAQISLWMQSSPREYRIKVIQSNAKPMKQEPYANSSKTYADLDNEKLQFKSNFRPRNRFLYFHYAVSILKLSYSLKNTSRPHDKELKERLGLGNYWPMVVTCNASWVY